ncbi:RNA polymerase sigma-54 factor [Marinobacterium sp. xm-g-59]|nr:RNA polymerase sigma-54 factor [Marinobacterium sp. xm-g-59]
MTPQLQQAIKLLQLSSLELQTEIQEALDSNPLLEVADEEDQSEENSQSIEQKESSTLDETQSNSEIEETFESSQPEDSWSTDDIPEQLSTDSQWDDTYQSSSNSNRDDDWMPGDNDTAVEPIQDHLNWQLNLVNFSDVDRYIAEMIIDSIDDRGYLITDLQDILLNCQEELPELFFEVEMDEVETVLHRIQQFDPPGVGARDLAECLKIQLRQLPIETPWRAESLRLATDYLNLLGSRDFKSLMRRMRLKEEQLSEVVRLIQSLNPTPGDSLDLGDTDYIVPDVIVRKRAGEWTLTLNNDVVPELRINDVYSGMIKRADNSAENQFLKDHLQDARWFIKSLQSRNETLLKVSTEIVSRQIGFLEQGEQAMKPLILHDIAEAVDLHESTISRVTTRKYMHTPRGVFELKYFFSSQVATSDGSGASSTAIRAIIKKLISEEDPRKPLSDSKLATLLDEEGVNVARRTIAKYREVLNIPPSNERKRLV